MNEYEAKIPALIQMALQNGATVTDLERILGEKAQQYLYDSGAVQKPQTQEIHGPPRSLSNLGMGGPAETMKPSAYLSSLGINPMRDPVPNENAALGINMSEKDAPAEEPSFWEKHFGGEYDGKLNRYSVGKDMSNYAPEGIASLFGLSNQIQRQNRNQRVAQQPPQNRYIQSLLGG